MDADKYRVHINKTIDRKPAVTGLNVCIETTQQCTHVIC